MNIISILLDGYLILFNTNKVQILLYTSDRSMNRLFKEIYLD